MSDFKVNNYINSDTNINMAYALAATAACMVLSAALIALIQSIDHVVRRTYNGDNIKDSKVVLILTAETGAQFYPIIGITKMAKLHLQNHTSIIYKDIASLDDYNQAIRSIAANNNTITDIYLRIHCEHNIIKFSQTSVVTREMIINEHCLSESLNLLAKDATITLHSCNSSYIAKAIAEVASEKLVVASSSKVNDGFTYIHWEGTSLKTRFGKPSSSTCTSKSFNALVHLYSFGCFGFKDTTVHFSKP